MGAAVRTLYPLALAASLGACAGTFPYRSDLDDNFTIRTRAKSGSLFSSVRAAVDVYRFDDQCRNEYEGTVDLGESEVEIGLPVDRPSRLVFSFTSSSWLANTRGQVAYEAVVEPRKAHDYDVAVSYRDDMYLVEIDERGPRGRGRLALHRASTADCPSTH